MIIIKYINFIHYTGELFFKLLHHSLLVCHSLYTCFIHVCYFHTVCVTTCYSLTTCVTTCYFLTTCVTTCSFVITCATTCYFVTMCVTTLVVIITRLIHSVGISHAYHSLPFTTIHYHSLPFTTIHYHSLLNSISRVWFTTHLLHSLFICKILFIAHMSITIA